MSKIIIAATLSGYPSFVPEILAELDVLTGKQRVSPEEIILSYGVGLMREGSLMVSRRQESINRIHSGISLRKRMGFTNPIEKGYFLGQTRIDQIGEAREKIRLRRINEIKLDEYTGFGLFN